LTFPGKAKWVIKWLTLKDAAEYLKMGKSTVNKPGEGEASNTITAVL
jgi:hypothetical protein